MRDPSNDNPPALAEVRERLRKLRGQQYWHAIEELADSSRFHRFLEAEFPQQARALFGAVNRHQALKVMAASLALGGLTACTRQPDERMVPWVLPPEEVVPGMPLFYATAVPFNGYGNGLLVESHMGRPTKRVGL
jgi:molybdopterin-containing oxidoreductase family iron-sulfur binding subunit